MGSPERKLKRNMMKHAYSQFKREWKTKRAEAQMFKAMDEGQPKLTTVVSQADPNSTVAVTEHNQSISEKLAERVQFLGPIPPFRSYVKAIDRARKDFEEKIKKAIEEQKTKDAQIDTSWDDVEKENAKVADP